MALARPSANRSKDLYSKPVPFSLIHKCVCVLAYFRFVFRVFVVVLFVRCCFYLFCSFFFLGGGGSVVGVVCALF